MVDGLSGNHAVGRGTIGKECVRYSKEKRYLEGVFGAPWFELFAISNPDLGPNNHLILYSCCLAGWRFQIMISENFS